MSYVEAPEPYTGPGPAVFLAGPISGAPNWQLDATRLLEDVCTVLNPRRAAFPAYHDVDHHDIDAATLQIRWEYEHLRRADIVLFWFPAGPTIGPIALYELGSMAASGARLVVGAHPDYPRCLDVVVQLDMIRPELIVHHSLTATCAALRAWLVGT